MRPWPCKSSLGECIALYTDARTSAYPLLVRLGSASEPLVNIDGQARTQTFAEYIDRVEHALSAGTRRAYGSFSGCACAGSGEHGG